MIRIEIPGRDELCIEHVLLDYNGTIAADGTLIPGVGELIGQRRALHMWQCSLPTPTEAHPPSAHQVHSSLRRQSV